MLNGKTYKMKTILRINTQLLNNNIEEHEFSYYITFSTHVLLIPTLSSDQAINFVKNTLSEHYLEDYSSLKVIIDSVKNI